MANNDGRIFRIFLVFYCCCCCLPNCVFQVLHKFPSFYRKPTERFPRPTRNRKDFPPTIFGVFFLSSFLSFWIFVFLLLLFLFHLCFCKFHKEKLCCQRPITVLLLLFLVFLYNWPIIFLPSSILHNYLPFYYIIWWRYITKIMEREREIGR